MPQYFLFLYGIILLLFAIPGLTYPKKMKNFLDETMKDERGFRLLALFQLMLSVGILTFYPFSLNSVSSVLIVGVFGILGLIKAIMGIWMPSYHLNLAKSFYKDSMSIQFCAFTAFVCGVLLLYAGYLFV